MKLRAADLRQLEEMGARTLGVNLRAFEPTGPEPSSVIEPEGEAVGARLIAGFVVRGRPVPWRVAIHRGGYATNPKFMVWKRAVQDQARKAMGNRKPFAGPFESRMSFFLRPRGSMPDLGNLVKGTLDALQEIVVVNDRDQRCERNHYDANAPEDRALIEVWTV